MIINGIQVHKNVTVDIVAAAIKIVRALVEIMPRKFTGTNDGIRLRYEPMHRL